jgi:hypothetical protein
MNDQQLRALVRDAVARHLGRAPEVTPTPHPALEPPPVVHHHQPHPWRDHASHQLYVSLVNVDGACVIEPAVACDHCGYCKSHGH